MNRVKLAWTGGGFAACLLVGGLLLPLSGRRVREASDRAKSQNNLKQIALAAHNYESAQSEPSPRFKSQNNLREIAQAMYHYERVHNHLPGPIRDENCHPLLSVRVALLRYLNCEELYCRFRIDQPWDSPHNRQVLDAMPGIYRSPGNAAPNATETFYRLVTGPGTAFEMGTGTPKRITSDGASALTVFWIEAGEAVPWTKPEEFEVHPDRPLPQVGGILERGTNVAFGDGRIEFIPRTASDATWRKLLKLGGRNDVKLPFDEDED